MFTNPIWHALQTRQSRFAEYAEGACKYATDVAPFAAVAGQNEEMSRALHSLLAPKEVDT